MGAVKHTPGPWKAQPFGINGSVVALVAEASPAENLLGTFTDSENEGLAVFSNAADGILSAAAPDLADALERSLLVIEALMPGVRHIAVKNYAELNNAPIAARIALRKAGRIE